MAPDNINIPVIGSEFRKLLSFISSVASAVGHPMLYNVDNPFDWMEMISLQGKTNFFERRVGEYQKKGVPRVKGDNNKNTCINSHGVNPNDISRWSENVFM